MARTSKLLFFIPLLFAISACAGKNTSELVGVITEIRGNNVTILTDDFKKANENQETGDLSFKLTEPKDLKVGKRIKVFIKGSVQTSFSATATVTRVEELSE